jgi:hypothetical protein
MLGASGLDWRYRWNISYHSPSQTSTTLADAQASLRPYLTTGCRKEFLLACWHLQPNDSALEKELEAYQSYFRHYEESCVYMPTSYPLLEGCTHEHFCQAIQALQQGTRKSCEETLETLLPPTSRSPEAAQDCINFVGKAILLIDLSGWSTDESLRDFITRTVASRSTQKDQYRIPLSFNARAFEKVAGIKIVWTRDLLSHLEVGLNDSTLALFHNMKVLQLYEQSRLRDIFPDNFLDETRRTLSLMLPIADKESMKWFNSEQRRLGLDVAAGDCRHLRATQRTIQGFNFWRDRLIMTKEVFDLSQPNGLLQFWRDDRNRVQWWTFWIAIVVFLLTLVGVIESALQVYKAYHPS